VSNSKGSSNSNRQYTAKQRATEARGWAPDRSPTGQATAFSVYRIEGPPYVNWVNFYGIRYTGPVYATESAALKAARRMWRMGVES
jgi:hypothetical protein